MNLVFSGRIGSGKTTLSKAVAGALGYSWVGFGNVIKAIATERGAATDRPTLQALGEQLVSEEPEELCRRVISYATSDDRSSLVIDGLRHLHIATILQRLLEPAPLLLIYVEIDEAVRLRRLAQRGDGDLVEIFRAERHSTEVQVSTEIKSCAKLIVDNSGETAVAVSKVVNFARSAIIDQQTGLR